MTHHETPNDSEVGKPVISKHKELINIKSLVRLGFTSLLFHPLYILLVECRTLWGEPERVHVQNVEQLHAHDRYQNVTEHKTSGHSR